TQESAAGSGSKNRANGNNDEGLNSDLPIQTDWTGSKYSIYSPGDKIFAITFGLLFPLAFTDSNYDSLANKVNLGGTGALSYLYFLNPTVFVGGELQGSFSQTIGENFIFLVPINFKLGYQFLWNRFEFPLSVGLGGAIHSYRAHSIFSLFMKAQASAFFRYNPSWSFGLNTAFWWCPEWSKEPEHDAYGHFFELTFSARYHF
ncbi:MAG: hypothetical protein LBV68_08820, partial [Spirochaetaceae bacterium]|nr:hypothetical protein [Spirochaetaceae bacterium]